MIARVAFTILAGESLSNSLHLYGDLPAMLEMPPTWDTAALTFRHSYDGGTFQNLYTPSGEEVIFPVAAACNFAFSTALFSGAQYLQLRSGTAAVPVNQTADRVIYLNLIW